MKRILFLFSVVAGVLTFSKVSSAEEVNAKTGGDLHSALQEMCPNAGESCIVLDTVVIGDSDSE